ncbi:MAG: DUF4249 domain-containing protein [Chitinophagaceae bacterium]
MKGYSKRAVIKFCRIIRAKLYVAGVPASYSPFTFYHASMLFLCLGLVSCVKDFDIKIKNNQPQLVVEAYINNLMRDYNYVILSRSLDYLSVNFQSTPVEGAEVYITEGAFNNNRYTWNPATRLQLRQVSPPMIPANFKTGVYFDQRLVTNAQNALRGIPGKSYLLEINEGGNRYSAITTLLPPVAVDSITSGFPFTDEEDNKRKLRLTNHFKDPDTLNNTQIFYYRFSENRNSFGWGGLTRTRTSGSDELTNGQYIHLTHPRGFVAGDTVHYYMASVTRDVYNFWDTFNKARDNNGPFATPISLKTNLQGTNVTGCFSGLSLSSKTIIMK